eukprot:3498557-Pyramimonas_sp.AAC.1
MAREEGGRETNDRTTCDDKRPDQSKTKRGRPFLSRMDKQKTLRVTRKKCRNVGGGKPGCGCRRSAVLWGR